MQTVSFAGNNYSIPTVRGDTPWSGLSDFVVAAASKAINVAGGNFTLLADINFGATFGLVSTYFKSRSSNAASAGAVRLANTDAIKWRNGANAADLALTITTNRLMFEGSRLIIAGAAEIVNADVSASAAIAYSKLALTGSIVNADVSASAAIAYSKLTLTGSIVNADVNASAAIAYSKLSLTGAIVNADISAAAAIAYSKLSLTGSIVNADISGSAAIALSKLAALGTAKALQSNASTGAIEVSAVTNTELGYVSGVTSAIQTQLNSKISETDWTSYTPTFVGWGTVANVSMFYRVVNKTLQIRGTVQIGTATAVAWSMTLPSGKTIDYTKCPSGTANTAVAGWSTFSRSGESPAAHWALIFADGSTTDKLFTCASVGNSGAGFVKTDGNYVNASSFVVIDAMIPIS